MIDFKDVLKNILKGDNKFTKPEKYDDYKRYEEADKLIKRLNMRNISFSGPEVRNYQDIIGFDEQKGMYVYTGIPFSDEDLEKIKDYTETLLFLERLKGYIDAKIERMDLYYKNINEYDRPMPKILRFIDGDLKFDRYTPLTEPYLYGTARDDVWDDQPLRYTPLTEPYLYGTARHDVWDDQPLINSIHDVKNPSPQEIEKIVSFIIERKNFNEDYSIPKPFRDNFEICKRCIGDSLMFANSVDWNYFSDHPLEGKELVMILYNKYGKSCYYYVNLFKIRSARDFLELYKIIKDPRLFDLIDYANVKNDLLPLSDMTSNSDAMSQDEFYVYRAFEFLDSIPKNPLTISSSKAFINLYLEKEWQIYMNKGFGNNLTNLFGRMISVVQRYNSFYSALGDFDIINSIAKELDDTSILDDFKEYFNTYHDLTLNNRDKKLVLLGEKLKGKFAKYVAFKKEEYMRNEYNNYIRYLEDDFLVKDKNSVSKKIRENEQKRKLVEAYSAHDSNLLAFIREIKDTYLSGNYSFLKDKEAIIDQYISNYINSNGKRFQDLINELNITPPNAQEYEEYLEISKLINRLNDGNITISDLSVQKFIDRIGFDGTKYFYNGLQFTEENSGQLKEFIALKYVLKKITDKLNIFARKIKINEDEIQKKINRQSLLFTDEFYTINIDRVLNRRSWEFLSEIIKQQTLFLDDTNYQVLNSLILSNGFLQFLMILASRYDSNELFNFYSKDRVISLIKELPTINSMLNPKNININNIGFLLDICNDGSLENLKPLLIVGTDALKKVCYNSSFLDVPLDSNKFTEEAIYLISNSCLKTESTVPYIEGTVQGFKYSTFAPLDSSILTSGHYTNSCFRVGGIDNDYLVYCILDKNGFVIKINDEEGNFVGKIPGIRNGNGVYLGQLLFKPGTGYQYDDELKMLIAKSVGNQILSISQNNEEEENKIDFVLFLSMLDLPTISSDTFDYFGRFPVEHSSEDWLEFKKTPYLIQANTKDFFTTDYSYSFAKSDTRLLATAVGDLTRDKIKQGDVPALYRKGKHIEETITNPQMHHELFVNKIRAIDAYLNNKPFEYLALPDDCILYIEDMGFRIMVNGEIYAECFLGQDGTKSVLNAFKV